MTTRTTLIVAYYARKPSRDVVVIAGITSTKTGADFDAILQIYDRRYRMHIISVRAGEISDAIRKEGGSVAECLA